MGGMDENRTNGRRGRDVRWGWGERTRDPPGFSDGFEPRLENVERMSGGWMASNRTSRSIVEDPTHQQRGGIHAYPQGASPWCLDEANGPGNGPPPEKSKRWTQQGRGEGGNPTRRLGRCTPVCAFVLVKFPMPPWRA
eukprot:scaffold684_cov345-Pavlova_lutheri.AAC.45